MFVRTGIVACPIATFVATLSHGATTMPARVVLDNVDRYRLPEPLFEGVRVILSYRGESYPPAYIQGISGAAFRIAGPCPCAPTCEWAMSTDDLIRLFGYECEAGPLADDPGLPPEAKPEDLYAPVLARIKQEIRAGRPVLVWNAFTTAEFDVVCGFDEGKHELIGRGSYRGLDDYAAAPESRPTEHDVAPAIGALFVGKKVKGLDARAAEIAALREAVLHAHGASASIGLRMPAGLACYDAWVASYENRGSLIRATSRDGKQDLDWVAAQSANDFYPLTIWPSTRQAAADFLRDLSPKYPEAKAHLEAAAGHFERESKALAACRDTLGDRTKPPSDEQCIAAAAHLRDARSCYALAIAEIARALREQILVTPRVELFEPGTIPRQEGKAIRVVDERR